VNFLIDFKGGGWPNDDNFDPMFPAKLLRQDKTKPEHPVPKDLALTLVLQSSLRKGVVMESTFALLDTDSKSLKEIGSSQ